MRVCLVLHRLTARQRCLVPVRVSLRIAWSILWGDRMSGLLLMEKHLWGSLGVRGGKEV